jgi:hypothetical protein
VTVIVRRSCADPDEARRLAAAISADNPAHVTAVVDGRVLELRVAPASAASARATLDDLLSGVAAAEGASRASRAPRRSGTGD